ncbi:MAG TPA: acyl carrier protein [Marinilabiliales bacterium]|jgi:acyl carrier protein|nr:MAG: acyl carrier protein [Bacteroidetes bacterium GWA2_40_14]OFX60212.1 MAG: acyl carrier protein [Bacteroidetes bacterium GWC2_40_13]OFX75034.1 MAG: acyl carrier protein [Bacteroidetes bacterium GWD2_40_43]OFX89630.1 MAG: acyl carrier protein [Bacteroidetes bacterium GWE2_40_63]OFY24148.1 MAG: acyl carrier protein [Bacteroidetes bacterium GWF2_40_13]OFZ26340.1 MAG: acyl carrier protein [Bacteroidetes bacterium RIFOXYC2_FULL_40_12]HAM99567.1 acyl carrier protein [Marinilabiliales bacteriu
MENLSKYDQVFISNLQVTQGMLSTLTYQSVPAWDSVGHMGLIAQLEEAFDIMIDTDDIIDFSSYQKGKEIIAKYGITL